jgi:hypothetical protein
MVRFSVHLALVTTGVLTEREGKWMGYPGKAVWVFISETNYLYVLLLFVIQGISRVG